MNKTKMAEKGPPAPGSEKFNQNKTPQATSTGIIEASRAARHKACPHHCNAADANGRNDRIDRHRNGMAATFGVRLSCRCRPQETRPQPCLRTNGQGSGLSYQRLATAAAVAGATSESGRAL